MTPPINTSWKDYHYPRNPAQDKKQPITAWKLMLLIDNRQIELIRGKYSLCQWKLNQITERNINARYKIVPA